MKIQRTATEVNNTNIKINNEPVENAKEFTYLGAVFTDNYDDSIEIKKRLAVAKNAAVTLD